MDEKEFWERFGWSWDKEIGHWDSPDGQCYASLPPITLDSLFKNAVPKLERKNLYDYIHFGFDPSVPELVTVQITWMMELLGEGIDKDPAQALYQAICKVIS